MDTIIRPKQIIYWPNSVMTMEEEEEEEEK
jgi:hypothetical protein